MKLSFLAGDLHLRQLEDGAFQILMAGQEILHSRFAKKAVARFNELRAEMETKYPGRELTQEEKQAILRESLVDMLLQHNSIGGRKKRTTASSTRTFGG
jgi:hypothetical protein